MSKESGIGFAVAVDDAAGPTAKTITNDVTDLQFSTPRGVQNATGVDSGANERILLLADFSFTLNGIFNDEADKSHAVFKTIGSTSVTRTVTLTHSGQVLEVESVLTDYQLQRAASGELTWSVPGAMNETTVPTWTTS